MNARIYLTTDEGTELIKTVKDAAIAQGWDDDDLEAEEYNLMDDLLAVVDAALAYLGLEVAVNFEVEDEDEEEDAFERMVQEIDGKRILTFDDAGDFYDKIYQEVEDMYPDENKDEKHRLTRETFLSFIEEYEIDGIYKESE